MEFSGQIIAVMEPRSGVSANTGRSWMTQEYVIEEWGVQYPRRMCFEVADEDKIRGMNIQKGEMMTVSFDINAREYQGRWYNSIRAWKVERAGGGQ